MMTSFYEGSVTSRPAGGRIAKRAVSRGNLLFFWLAVLALGNARCYSEGSILSQSVVAIVGQGRASPYTVGIVFPSARWIVSTADPLQAMGKFTVRLPNGRSLRPRAWYADKVSNVGVIDLGAPVRELRPVVLSAAPPIRQGERLQVVTCSRNGSLRYLSGVIVGGEVVRGAIKLNLLELPSTSGLSGAAVVGPQETVLGLITGTADRRHFVAYWKYLAVRRSRPWTVKSLTLAPAQGMFKARPKRRYYCSEPTGCR